MEMTVSLEQEMWNAIITLLAEHPYKQSATLIHGIGNQLRNQMEAQQVYNPRQRTNGEDVRPGVD